MSEKLPRIVDGKIGESLLPSTVLKRSEAVANYVSATSEAGGDLLKLTQNGIEYTFSTAKDGLPVGTTTDTGKVPVFKGPGPYDYLLDTPTAKPSDADIAVLLTPGTVTKKKLDDLYLEAPDTVRWPDNGNVNKVLAQTGANGTINFVTPGLNEYQVRQIVSAMMNNQTAPPAPTALTINVVPGSNQNNITYTGGTSSNPVYYSLYRGTSSSVTPNDGALISSYLPYVDTGLDNNTTYYYVATATSAGGVSTSAVVSSAPKVENASYWISDSLTEADGVLLQSHTGELNAAWLQGSGALQNGLVFSSNRVRSNSGSNGVFYTIKNYALPSSNYIVDGQLYVASVGTTSAIGVFLRGPSTGGGYGIRYSNSNSAWQLHKLSSGTTTNLLASSPATLTAGSNYKISIKAVGTTITASVDNNALMTVTDSTFTEPGLAGIYGVNASGATIGHHMADFHVGPAV